MKVLFAVNNENVSESIVKQYQQEYKEIISSKNVYYFNAILKELQKDKTYDRIVISEDLEPFANNNYETIDKFIFDKLDSISDEASNNTGADIPIILICTDRRNKGENLLIKLFGIGIYSALIGQDRSIDNVCNLINKPRSKKEAKSYYKIDSDDVEYKVESDVSEVEIQNILTHYKRLGKNEEAYVESFNSIASQYTDSQLRLIAQFLPLNVKAVLEASSPKYQEIMTFGESKKIRTETAYKPTYPNKKSKTIDKRPIGKIDIIEKELSKPALNKPVIIPSAVNTERIKKIETEKISTALPVTPVVESKNVRVEEPVKRKRGRPKKVQPEEEATSLQQVEEPVKKKRGRPKKVQVEEVKEPEERINLFELAPEVQEETFLPGIEEQEEVQESPVTQMATNYSNYEPQMSKDLQPQRIEENKTSFNQLLTRDKKIVAFVGTSKNGTSFLVNNLAEMFSKRGIKTAILDLTKNRNAYYIYTENEESLRNIAFDCIENLRRGISKGIEVNKNLTVYTSLPGEDQNIRDCSAILETLVKNYSLILLDCDFETEYSYFDYAQEIYLVQSLDILTIQPLTAFLRDLKAKNILEPSKIKIVINKALKVRTITEKTIIGGMAYYNDPSMSFMTELFNKDEVRYVVIPFDEQVYSKYLEGLVNCKIVLTGYGKNFMDRFNQLSNMVYPLLVDRRVARTDRRVNQYGNYGGNQNFSYNMNNTLDKMKKKY